MVEATVRPFRACMHACMCGDEYYSMHSVEYVFAVVPVIPVAISAGIIHEQYGTEE